MTLLQQRQREYDQLQTAIMQVERGEYQPLDIEMSNAAAERDAE